MRVTIIILKRSFETIKSLEKAGEITNLVLILRRVAFSFSFSFGTRFSCVSPKTFKIQAGGDSKGRNLKSKVNKK